MHPFITAHSGADRTPDNSLAFVRYALRSSADALEIDIRHGTGGRLVISHDEAEETAPALEEVFRLAAAHPSMKINCDLKMPGLEEAVCEMAEEAGLAGRLIFSGTVDAEKAASVLKGRVQVYLNMEEYVPDLYRSYREIPNFELQAASVMTDVCLKNGIRVVNIHQALVTKRLIDTLAAHGIGISAWTVNEPEELQWFLSNGVANITTRSLQTALELRRAYTTH